MGRCTLDEVVLTRK